MVHQEALRATYPFQTGGERGVSGRLIAAHAPQTLGPDES